MFLALAGSPCCAGCLHLPVEVAPALRLLGSPSGLASPTPLRAPMRSYRRAP